ncbi:hypothetical protein ACQ4M4_19265 [Leptolyngbya sp. AN02str]|uniref:hypothetical protein n=1 Tax=Leptolyngbya sp. AN02str TaxID=3423363 RepID=UPI003D313355
MEFSPVFLVCLERNHGLSAVEWFPNLAIAQIAIATPHNGLAFTYKQLLEDELPLGNYTTIHAQDSFFIFNFSFTRA